MARLDTEMRPNGPTPPPPVGGHRVTRAGHLGERSLGPCAVTAEVSGVTLSASRRTDREVAGALRRAEHARDRMQALREEQERLVRERDEAIRALSQAGMSYDAIGRAAGVSRARVGQIVTASGDDRDQRSA